MRFFILGLACKFIDYKVRGCCLVDKQKGLRNRMFLSGLVLELSLLSVLTKFVIKSLPEQNMEFIKIHGDFIGCGYGFFVIHG